MTQREFTGTKSRPDQSQTLNPQRKHLQDSYEELEPKLASTQRAETPTSPTADHLLISMTSAREFVLTVWAKSSFQLYQPAGCLVQSTDLHSSSRSEISEQSTHFGFNPVPSDLTPPKTDSCNKYFEIKFLKIALKVAVIIRTKKGKENMCHMIRFSSESGLSVDFSNFFLVIKKFETLVIFGWFVSQTWFVPYRAQPDTKELQPVRHSCWTWTEINQIHFRPSIQLRSST